MNRISSLEQNLKVVQKALIHTGITFIDVGKVFLLCAAVVGGTIFIAQKLR